MYSNLISWLTKDISSLQITLRYENNIICLEALEAQDPYWNRYSFGFFSFQAPFSEAEGVLEASWAVLGGMLGRLAGFFKNFGSSWSRLGRPRGIFGASLGVLFGGTPCDAGRVARGTRVWWRRMPPPDQWKSTNVEKWHRGLRGDL